MEERPNDLIGKAGVKLGNFVAGERYALEAVGAAASSFLQKSCGGLGVNCAGPANPDSVSIAPNAVESGGKPARALRKPRMAGAELYLNRQAV